MSDRYTEALAAVPDSLVATLREHAVKRGQRAMLELCDEVLMNNDRSARIAIHAILTSVKEDREAGKH